MKNYTMFNYNYLFSDHFAKISNQAKLYYVALNFYAINGFVPNPIQILDSLGYDRGVYNELVANEELLTLDSRSEVFITSYFAHNPGITPYAWRQTPYFVYWEHKLHVKKNGIVTFKPQGTVDDPVDPLENVKDPVLKEKLRQSYEKMRNNNDDASDE